ncbi:MAG: hypothetical protein AVDCRST_MAG78-2125 [uncultured Rubrobacteraceae bacterium]|uniref:Uncharacterized protein n=1 Tax=uncultured Rubrobacteraceae bacterium TaxID=349277 RepID=A0A6J4Q8S7_9ACTN|nr:MAG: hypothetical protein AVDCRST_MAG78-2125 [uncultured Rubrobacteraceae bacterium]
MDFDEWGQFMEQVNKELEEQARLGPTTYVWKDTSGDERKLTVTKNTTRGELKQLPDSALEDAEGRIVDSLLAEAGYVHIVRDGKELAKHRDALTIQDIPAVRAWRELQSEKPEAQLDRLKALHFILEAGEDIDHIAGEDINPNETVGDRLRKLYPNIKSEVREPWWRRLFGHH